ncbi:hypothetical protein [Rhodoplanes sp. Z2-YC6860]|uniref:hypothetical protein n=1 Tax=Rhodoplanes sp. Z2-YC6860 TaxID=674703 RepID=UPI000830B49F|nr:hypothetical protein [Rhodoplanes sp. Z2-YC6860]
MPKPKLVPDQSEMPDDVRRRDQPIPDAPATVPTAGEEGLAPGALQPTEDGGVAQHPLHDSDTEDLDSEDYEELTDEVEDTGIKPERRQ